VGLVDEIGFIEDAIARAAKLANLDEKSVRAVKYTQPRGVMDQLLFGGGGQRSNLAMLFDLATPRAYYLCTWLPGLAPAMPK
jgi:protease-4